MTSRRLVVGAGLALSLGGAAAAYRFLTAPGKRSGFNTIGSSSGVAIRGYDPVAYFAAGAPRPGKPEHAVVRDGVTWLFASAENKSLFERDAEKYLPAYGGYCAYGVAKGYLVKIEPEAWSIRSGRLYLNYDLAVKGTWEVDPDQYIRAADQNWTKLAARN